MAKGVPALHPERRGSLNISPRENWVEKRGGLPPYLNSVATALVRQGMTRSRAIQTAVNVMKKTCATGLWGGRPNIKISPAIRAAACAAVAQWEKMKVSTSVPSDSRMAIELAKTWEPDEREPVELLWQAVHGTYIQLTGKVDAGTEILELAHPSKPSLSRRAIELVRRAIFGPEIELASPPAAKRKRAEKKGAALPGGRFPIENRADLQKAIRAVGRATDAKGRHSEAERRKVRRFIIRRARAIGAQDAIPSNWLATGALK